MRPMSTSPCESKSQMHALAEDSVIPGPWGEKGRSERGEAVAVEDSGRDSEEGREARRHPSGLHGQGLLH